MRIKKMIGVGIVLSSACLVHGETIQFDFSRNAGNLYSGIEAPAALSAASSNWNEVVSVDIGSGLVYSDGTAATGVTLDVGKGDTIDWSLDLKGYGAVDATAPAIYQTLLMSDWNYTSNGDSLGVRVAGLAAGEYEVYAILREPNTDGWARTYDVGIGLNGSALGDAGMTTSSIALDTVPDGTPAWTAGMNYVMTTVTVGSLTDAVTVITDNTNHDYGTLAGVQIVAIPEPGTLGLIAAFGGGLLFMRRRFQR